MWYVSVLARKYNHRQCTHRFPSDANHWQPNQAQVYRRKSFARQGHFHTSNWASFRDGGIFAWTDLSCSYAIRWSIGYCQGDRTSAGNGNKHVPFCGSSWKVQGWIDFRTAHRRAHRKCWWIRWSVSRYMEFELFLSSLLKGPRNCPLFSYRVIFEDNRGLTGNFLFLFQSTSMKSWKDCKRRSTSVEWREMVWTMHPHWRKQTSVLQFPMPQTQPVVPRISFWQSQVSVSSSMPFSPVEPSSRGWRTIRYAVLTCCNTYTIIKCKRLVELVRWDSVKAVIGEWRPHWTF